MTALVRLLHALPVAAVLAVAGLAALSVGRAEACSCADDEPRDALEAGQPALIGRVVSKAPVEGAPTRYVVRVEHSLNARLGEEAVVMGYDSQSGCGFTWRVGQRVATFLYRRGGDWTANLCTLVRPAEMERALRPYPRPRGTGRVALLAAGSFGNARVMALDERGRVLGYGFGEGVVRSISVCPGSATAAELVTRGRGRALVAVRSLTTLGVVSSAPVPDSIRQIACADSSGATVYAAGIGYKGRPLRGTGRVLRLAGGSVTKVFTGPAEQVGLGTRAAYLWSRREIASISLTDGSARPLLRVGLPDYIAPSPDGSLVAVHDFEGRLQLVGADGAPGARRSHELIGAVAWLAPDRLLVRAGGRAYLYDPELRLVRRYRFYRAYLQAPFEGGVFGLDRYRLVRLDLASGRKETAGRLPDRGIADLAGVPDGPVIDVPRRAPRGFSETARRTRSGPAARPGARTARWMCARSRRG